MDGQKIEKNKSLQSQLSVWVSLAVVVFSLITTAMTAYTSFKEASEQQDHTLETIADLVTKGNISKETPYVSTKEEAISVSLLNEDLRLRFHFQKNVQDGFYQIVEGGKSWRAYVRSLTNESDKVVVFQQIEARDEIAWNSIRSAFLPIMVLLVLLLLAIRLIIGVQFRPLRALSDFLQQQNINELKILPTEYAFLEVKPFLKSINNFIERTQSSIERQKRFIADAAHELRTPVAALSLLAENIQQAKSNEDLSERQKQLASGLTRLRNLVNQLLDLARWQNTVPSEARVVFLNEVVQEMIADLIPLAEAKGINLGVVRNEPLKVKNKDLALQQLTRNALENALFYTPAGGSVDVSVFLDRTHAVLTIEDTGPGLTDQDEEKIWQAFYSATPRESDHHGNGLGLAIVSEIAKQLQGSATLMNRPQGGGAVFRYEQDVVV
ncbi:MAG: sensor histidine kinase [Bdellovibrionaceae bacterium]|nr:sensor histidine kinase [Pseudobdellovibrionaceae bacterium]